METKKLLKVSNYAKSIGKSTELIRVWIRTGKWTYGKEVIMIDGVTFVNLENIDNN